MDVNVNVKGLNKSGKDTGLRVLFVITVIGGILEILNLRSRLNVVEKKLRENESQEE